MKNLLCSIWLLTILSACTTSTSYPSSMNPNLKKLANGFKWGEGPTSDSKGNIYFTDVRQSMIFIWTTDQQLDTFRTDGGGANGLYFDKNDNLYACEVKRGRITKTTPSGKYSVVIDKYQGKPFNEPNDLWLDGKGGIYFSDPKFGKGNAQISQDGMHVYYLHPDGSTVTRVIDDFEKPNGLIGSAAKKVLYVTDVGAGKTYQYSIQDDGMLTNKTLFTDAGADGMTMDKSGNIYLTTNGKNAVDIFSPSGKLIKSIDIPERAANVCFSKIDTNQLFVTGESALYTIDISKVLGK